MSFILSSLFVQEGLCADSASFDLHSGGLAACISEAQECVNLASKRRGSLNDASMNPETFAILKGYTRGLYCEYNDRLYMNKIDMSMRCFILQDFF